MTGVTPPRLPPVYVVESVLGQGGMGLVLKARHRELQRSLAVKVLLHHLVKDPQWIGRMEQEARLSSKIAHPNVVRVVDWGHLEGGAYVAFELVEGESLASRLDRGPIAPGALLDLALPLAEGLAAIHAAGVIHRDLKPANVLLAGHGPVIADLGIAREVTGGSVKTKTGMLLGTPEYIAPELIESAQGMGPSIDVYGLGILLYEMATGRPPFQDQNLGALLRAHMKQAVPPLAELEAELPAPLARLIHRCLEKKPADRPTAAGLAEELAAITAGGPRTPPPVIPSRSRIPGALVAAAVVIFITTLLLSRPSPAPAPSPPTPTPTSSAASPSPLTTSPLFPLPADSLEAYDQALQGKPERVQRTLLELEKKCGFSLANPTLKEKDVWRNWILLLKYLLNGGSPPRFFAEEADFETHSLLEVALDDVYDKVSGPKLLAQIYRGVVYNPEDGRPWIVLGGHLEREGRLEAADRCYDLGFSRLPEHLSLGRCPVSFWDGVIMAFTRQRGRDLEKDLRPLVVRARRGSRVMDILHLWIPDRITLERYEKLLATWIDDPDIGVDAAISLGTHLKTTRQYARAEEVWSRVLPRSPDNIYLVDGLVQLRLSIGRWEEARDLRASPNIAGHASGLIDLLAPGSPLPGLRFPPVDDPSSRLLVMVCIGRHLEAGKDTVIKDCLETALTGRTTVPPEWLPAMLYLVGKGTDIERYRPFLASQVAATPGDSRMWEWIAGFLATPQGEPTFRAIQEHALKSTGKFPQLFLAEALWRSRQGQYRESLEVLARWRGAEAYPATLAPETVLEVLSRPFWDPELSGQDRPHLEERLKDLPTFSGDERLVTFLKFSMRGDLASAVQPFLDPFHPWPRSLLLNVAPLWLACREGRSSEVAARAASLRCRILHAASDLWYLPALVVMPERCSGPGR